MIITTARVLSRAGTRPAPTLCSCRHLAQWGRRPNVGAGLMPALLSTRAVVRDDVANALDPRRSAVYDVAQPTLIVICCTAHLVTSRTHGAGLPYVDDRAIRQLESAAVIPIR